MQSDTPGPPETAAGGFTAQDDLARAYSSLEAALKGDPDLLKTFREMRAARDFRKDSRLLIALATRDTQALEHYVKLTKTDRSVLAAQAAGAPGGRSAGLSPDLLARIPSGPRPAPPPEYLLAQAADVSIAELATGTTYRPPERARPLAEIYSELGHTYAGQCAYSEAAQAFLDALRYDAADADLHLYLACVREGQERFYDAARSYLEAIARRPGCAPQALPRVYRIFARLPDGARPLARWLEGEWAPAVTRQSLDPAVVVAIYRFLACAARYRQERSVAIKHFERALALRPDDLFCLEWLGETFREQRAPAEAHKTLVRAVEVADTAGSSEARVATRLKLGHALLDLKRPEKALAAFEQALALCPSPSPPLLTALAEGRRALGRAGEALAAAEAALALDAGDVEALAQYAAAQYELKQYGAAGAAADAALKLAPDHALALKVAALALLDAPTPAPDVPHDQAIALLQRSLKAQPGDFEAHRRLVQALRDSRRPAAEVVAALKAALEHAPAAARPALQIELAEAALQQDRTERKVDCIQLLEAAARHSPELRTAHWWLLHGDGLREAGKTGAALESYSQGLAAEPANTALLERRAALLQQQGDPAGAREAWRAVAAADPDRAEAQLRIAQIAHELGELPAALDAVDAALAGALEGDLELQAYDLRCQVLQSLGRPREEIAAAYLDAGQHCYYASSYPAAIARLWRARRLDRTNAAVCWYLAEAFMLDSQLPQPPFVDARKLRRGCAFWEAGNRLMPRDESYPWRYITRAQICLLRSFLPGSDPYAECWQAATFVERHLLLEQWDAGSYALLARLHRTLENNAAALQAAAKALELDPENVSAVEEQIGILTNVGRCDEALELVLARGELAPTEWLAGVKGMLMGLKTGADYPGAIEQLTGCIAAQPYDLWLVRLRAEYYRRDGQWPKALEDYRSIWRRHGDPAYQSADNLNGFAWAAYSVGVLQDPVDDALIHQAAHMFKDLACKPLDAATSLHNYALCLLTLGALHGEQAQIRSGTARAQQAIAGASNNRELDDIVYDLQFLERRAAQWSPGVTFDEALAQLREAVATRRAEVAEQPSAEAELRCVAASPGSWADLGAWAGVARLCGADAEEPRWDEVAAIYEAMVQKERGAFLEARDGLATAIEKLSQKLLEDGDVEGVVRAQRRLTELSPERAVDASLTIALALEQADRAGEARDELRKAMAGASQSDQGRLNERLGDLFAKAGQLDDAEACFVTMLKAASAGGDAPRQAAAHARLATIAAAHSDIPRVVERLRTVLEAEASAAESFSTPLSAAADALQGAFRAPTAPECYLSIAEALRILTPDCAATPPMQQALIKLRLDLAQTCYPAVLRPPASLESPILRLGPTPRPVMLWADARMFPQMAATPEVLRMLTPETGDIEQMRQRIRESTGVPIPGVLISPYYDNPNDEGDVLTILDRPLIFAESYVRRHHGPLGEGGYLLLLNEIVVERGAVPYAAKFCPDGAACRALRLEGSPGVNHATGEEGLWLEQAAAQQAEGGGLALWDAYEYMLRHLEAVIRRNLHLLLGVQEVQDLLDTWVAEDSEARQALVQDALPDNTAVVRLAQALRQRVRASTPINDLEVILRAFTQAAGQPARAEVAPTAAPGGTGWDEAALRARLGELGIAAYDRAAVIKLSGDLSALGQPFESCVEAAFERLQAGRIELHVSPGALRALAGDAPCDGPVDAGDGRLDEQLRRLVNHLVDGLFVELGLWLPALQWTPSPGIPEGMLAVKVGDLLGAPVGPLRPDEALVTAIAGEIRRRAGQLLSAAEVEFRLANLAASFPLLVTTALTRHSAEALTRALRASLREGGSIRDLRAALEKLLSAA